MPRIIIAVTLALLPWPCLAQGSSTSTAAPQPAAVKPAAPPQGGAGIEWVTIPGGSFMMGADDGRPDARPKHQVTVKTFQMAKTLVTNKQYQACVKAGACTSPHDIDGTCQIFFHAQEIKPSILPKTFQDDDQPVVCVDWHQAKGFAKWVGGRLPSEAEYEYAARSGGKDIKYPWGDETPTCERVVIVNEKGRGCGRETTWPVCSKPKGNTSQGLCDMAGNVYEWLQDWYHDSYTGAPSDGSAWVTPPAGKATRVGRGGSWVDTLTDQTVDTRFRGEGDFPFNMDNTTGFRPAKSL